MRLCNFLTLLLLFSDCYVAICGVPTPRADHAVAMARFATECLSKMNSLTKELEAILVRLFEHSLVFANACTVFLISYLLPICTRFCVERVLTQLGWRFVLDCIPVL